jgi:hypothetical protein
MYVLAAISARLDQHLLHRRAKDDIGALQLVVSLGLLVGSAAECIVVLLVCGRRRSIVSRHTRFEANEVNRYPFPALTGQRALRNVRRCTVNRPVYQVGQRCTVIYCISGQSSFSVSQVMNDIWPIQAW